MFCENVFISIWDSISDTNKSQPQETSLIEVAVSKPKVSIFQAAVQKLNKSTQTLTESVNKSIGKSIC